MANTPLAAIPDDGARRAVAVAAAGMVTLAVAMGIGRFAFTPLLPMMQQDAGVSVSAGAWLASANYLGYFLGALSAVWLHMSAPMTIRVGLVVIGVTTLAMGLTGHFVLWALLRMMAGIASAWVLVHATAWCLQQLTRLRRATLGGVVFGGVGVGIAVSGAVCLALMQAKVGSSPAWIVFGTMALMLALGVWPVFDGTPAPPAQAARVAARQRWDGESIRLILCYGAYGLGYIIPATFLPLMAKRVVADPAVFGWSWPVFGLAALVSTLAAAPLQRRFHSRRLWSASHLVMALGVALPVAWPGIGGIMLSALLVGCTFVVVVMFALREAGDVGGRQATNLFAAMTAAFAIGQILGPIGAGLVAGIPGGFSLSLIAASLALVISAWSLARQRPTPMQAETPEELR